MSDELSYLLGRGRTASLSAEQMELMGKQAANMLLEQKIPLNEGVAKLAGAHPDINGEQVKRICEFANTAVYLAKHDMAKTAGDSSSYPVFDLADPGRIIQDLSDGARPTVVTPIDMAYSRIPQREKMSAAKADSLLEEMFGKADAEKRASLDFTSETAVNEVMQAKQSLVSLKEHLQYAGERYDLLQKEASEQYFDLVKTHILEGNSFADVMVSARSTGLDNEKIASIISPVVERLVMEKVASPNRLAAQVQGFEKVAHRMVNEQHPLVTTFAALVDMDDKIEKIATGLRDTDEQLGRIDKFIKEAFCARTPR